MGRTEKFVPDYFFSPRQIESMTGVYFPYWLYSCKVKGDLQAEGKTVRTWETAGMRYTETKVYDIQRTRRYECRLCSPEMH